MDNPLKLCPTDICVACLSTERNLSMINDQQITEMLRIILNKFKIPIGNILLCYECVGRLKSVLRFQKNVQNAYKYLSEYMRCNIIPTSLTSLEISKTETYEWKPHCELSNTDICKDEENTTENLIESDNEISDNTELYDFNPKATKRKRKLEIPNIILKNVTDGHQNNAWELKIENAMENNENFVIKEEPGDLTSTEMNDDLKMVTKCEFSESDDEPLKAKNVKKKKVKKEVKEQKREQPPGVVTGVWVQKKLKQLNVTPGQMEMVVLSWEEVESERQKCMSLATYTRHDFRCPLCVVGFNHRFKLDSHMMKHRPEAGELECGVCKTRFKTQSALLSHKQRHRSRWRCTQCLSLFSRAAVAADHVSRAHGAPPPTHTCHVCAHQATSLGKLRVHLKSHAERQHCEQCGKTFRDKSSLKTHLYIHTDQMDFSCEVCGKKFRFKKALETHSITHQASELLYCADCDMNFKNRLSFYQHINYSMKHIHPDKIKYACEFCPRRFSKPGRLEEHRLSIHLKLAPHRCRAQGCQFASASRPALRTHTRMVHRNKRLERNHVCHTCGKAYTTKKILEGHIRSHTGERPFICTKCPATFSHDAALYNHNKLVHKTPFVRRRRPNTTISEQPLNWSGEMENTEKPCETPAES